MGGLGLGLGLGLGGGALLSPKDMAPGCILQLDLDDSRNVVTGSGLSLVWNEADGATVHATQGTDANRPALGTGGLNGHQYAEFDGAASWMDLSGLTSASHDYTFFAVLKNRGTIGLLQLLMSWTNYGGLMLTDPVEFATGIMEDSSASAQLFRTISGAAQGGQCLTWRVDDLASYEGYRDGKLLGSRVPAGSQTIGATCHLGKANWGSTAFFDGDLYYLVVFAGALSVAAVAQINAWLMARFGLTATMNSIANLGAWWDLDHATVTGGVLTAVTDRALADTINVVGSPAIVSVGGDDFVRFDGTDDVLWIADAAALDGAAGCTHVLKHANHEALPVDATLAQKGRSAVHLNGGIGGHGSAGTRFTAVCNSGNDADVGPLVELATPAETIAMAIESAAAVRRIDGDGTYASTATAQTTAVGAGSLTWGARETGASTFDEYTEADLRAAAYYARPLNQYELIAAHAMLRDGP